jgi:hypothetical protein
MMKSQIGLTTLVTGIWAALALISTVALFSLIDLIFKPDYSADPGPLGYDGSMQLDVGLLTVAFIFGVIGPISFAIMRKPFAKIVHAVSYVILVLLLIMFTIWLAGRVYDFGISPFTRTNV